MSRWVTKGLCKKRVFAQEWQVSHGKSYLWHHSDIKIRACMSKRPQNVAILTYRRVFWCQCDVSMSSRDSLCQWKKKMNRQEEWTWERRSHYLHEISGTSHHTFECKAAQRRRGRGQGARGGGGIQELAALTVANGRSPVWGIVGSWWIFHAWY